MNIDKSASKISQPKKVEELYWDVRHWNSKLLFMEDEIAFIDGLFDSYIFEPNTSNLFIELEDYLNRLKTAKHKNHKLDQQISVHRHNLGGMLERRDKTCDAGFYQKHDALKAEVVLCVEDFQSLKAEIFNYAGGILKKRKRNSKKK